MRMGLKMKFKIDENECIGCGACAATCPEVFEIPDDIAQVILSPVPEHIQESALAAESGCPVEVITHITEE
jgi:ferredoxin